MKLIAANSQSDLATIRMSHEIARKKSLKYLILDASINRKTTRLDRGIITVSEFLSIASNFTYNPARHCGLQPAPAPTDQPILVARRRLVPPPVTQQIDSDSP
jgi:hypothetical protein